MVQCLVLWSGEGTAKVTAEVRTELDRISEIAGRRFQIALMGLKTHPAHLSPAPSELLGTPAGLHLLPGETAPSHTLAFAVRQRIPQTTFDTLLCLINKFLALA